MNKQITAWILSAVAGIWCILLYDSWSHEHRVMVGIISFFGFLLFSYIRIVLIQLESIVNKLEQIQEEKQ